MCACEMLCFMSKLDRETMREGERARHGDRVLRANFVGWVNKKARRCLMGYPVSNNADDL